VITATPVDKTPPLPPIGVTAVETSSGIKVFWDRSDDTDVAGYRIYRRLADKKVPTFLGEVSSTYTLFVDANVPKGVRVYYSVTAFDRSKPANESDQSREATIR
jgi:fibronectin type 3 domain-containing protein